MAPPDAPEPPSRPLARGEGAPRVLVVRLSALGDVLHALPAAAALRRARPQARIDWLVEDRAASLLGGHPALDRVHVVPRARWSLLLRRPASWPRLAAEASALVARLWRTRYDAALDLQGNLKSGLWTWLSGAPARYGFESGHVREGNAFFTNRRVRVGPDDTHRILRDQRAVSVLLRDDVPYADPGLPRREAEAAWAREALESLGPSSRGYAVLHPGTSGFGAFKRWPPASFARLADRLASDAGLRVVLTAGPGEEALVEAVRSASRTGPVALSTPSLPALVEVVRGARLVVAGDTGPLHVAAALGTPLVGLYGPKDPDVYGPFGLPPEGGPPRRLPVVVREDVACRPCPLRWCPEPICMTSIDPDDVFRAALASLSRSRADAPVGLG